MKFNSTMFFALAACGVASVIVLSPPAVAGALTDPTQQTHCKAVGNAYGKKAKELQGKIKKAKQFLDATTLKSMQDIEKTFSDLSKAAKTIYGSANPPSKAEQKTTDDMAPKPLLNDFKACFQPG